MSATGDLGSPLAYAGVILVATFSPLSTGHPGSVVHGGWYTVPHEMASARPAEAAAAPAAASAA